jgi:Flp pilus assembly pilin Flp
MGASQCVGITFGPWFEDEFGFTSAALIAVVIISAVTALGTTIKGKFNDVVTGMGGTAGA